MKTKNLLNIMLAFIVSIAFFSCVEDDDFSIPESLGMEENNGVQQILTDLASGDLILEEIENVKLMYDSSEALPFEVDDNIVIMGYVSSSDQTGNFYKEIYIQDNFENPTSAIKVIINQTDLYNKFNKGRQVFIKLNGLLIGEERVGNGVITIGGGSETDQYGTTVTSLGLNQVNSKMFRSTITMDIVPVNVALNEISNQHLGMFVQVDGVEFAEDLDGKRYFDPIEDFDTQRMMQACTGFEYSTFILETSSFADFKSEMLPTANGSIAGIIVKDYFGEVLLMALNTTDDVNFEDSRCSLLNIEDFSVAFEEDFTDGLTGWEVTNTVGTREWYATGYGGVSYIRGSGYSSGSIVDMVSWLISPSIDFDAQDDELMILQIADAYSNGQPLKAYYSNDYTVGQDPSTATWVEIGTAEIDALNDNTGFFDNNYEEATIDASSIVGNAVIAFVYDSNNATVSTTIDLSSVMILGQ